MIIDAIRDYILTCPLLKATTDTNFITLNVDYSQSDQATTYSISETVCQPVLKTYTNGSTENQFIFTLSSVEYFGSDATQNIANINFYEQFSDWLKANNKAKIFPTLEADKQPFLMKATTNGYLFDNQVDMSKARYVIQIQMKYDQK